MPSSAAPLFRRTVETFTLEAKTLPQRYFPTRSLETTSARDAVEFWDVTNKQDWHVCELSEEGVASRGYQRGPYSRRESIPAAWDREYLRYVR
jgi:hypothetical protein